MDSSLLKNYSVYKPPEFKRPYQIRVVLVRPIYPRNIGSVSRAMSNMGAEQLVLIAPQCELDYEAQQAAATGQFALQNRKTYTSWDDFFKNEPEGLRLSLTARDGKGRLVRNLKDLVSELPQIAPQLQLQSEHPVIIDLIFGPEDWGLSAEDLELSHFACSLPTFGENWSLNLSQAVLLSLFILRDCWGGVATTLDGQKPRRLQGRQRVFPEKTLFEWLEQMGFDLSKKKTNAYTVLKRMLLQNTPTEKELKILEIVLQQSIRKLREYNELVRERLTSRSK